MVPLDVVNDVSRHYISDSHDVDSGIRELVLGYLRARSYPELASCTLHFDPAKHTIREFRFLRQVAAFYKKNVLLSNGAECKSHALASFMESEDRCSETNRRLLPYIGHEHLLDAQYQVWVRRMKHYICNVLGNFDSFVSEIPSLVKVTSGATAHSARRDSLPQLKMKNSPYCTPRAVRYLYATYRYFGFNVPGFKACHTNRVETVPKNWKTDRTIACEPEGNLPFQLAFDTWTKRKLKPFGINLSDQSSNQRAALTASKVNGDVTVDFSKASDTIAYNPVVWLFPPDWARYLCDVRTPGYRGSGLKRGVYAKFSSMGNGSTFAIETLLFAAACYAVGARKFLVYGDDVIIGRDQYEPFCELTRFLGFTVNSEKSFSDGPFRESCGMDAYDGVDVTPTYIRQLDGRKACKSHFVNSLLGLTYPGSGLLAYLRSLTGDWGLPVVPYQESSMSGVWINPDTARRLGVLKRKHGLDTFKAYVPKTRKRSFVDERGYYLWFLNKHSQVLFGAPWDVARKSPNHVTTQTSVVPVFRHAYVRKRVSWFPADGLMPNHLVWWSAAFEPAAKAAG